MAQKIVRGSFEDFCSGGGIARAAVPRLREWTAAGRTTLILAPGQREALYYTRQVCEVAPAGLGEQLGDYAALSVAKNLLK